MNGRQATRPICRVELPMARILWLALAALAGLAFRSVEAGCGNGHSRIRAKLRYEKDYHCANASNWAESSLHHRGSLHEEARNVNVITALISTYLVVNWGLGIHG
jgi:hypothetical protein